MWRILMVVMLFSLFVGCLSGRPFRKPDDDESFLARTRVQASKGFEDAKAVLAIFSSNLVVTDFKDDDIATKNEWQRAEVFVLRTFPNLSIALRKNKESNGFQEKYRTVLKKVLLGEGVQIEDFCFLDGQSEINHTCLVNFINIARYGEKSTELGRWMPVVPSVADTDDREINRWIVKFSLSLQQRDLELLHAMTFSRTRDLAAIFTWQKIGRLVYAFESFYLEKANLDSFCATSIMPAECSNRMAIWFAKYEKIALVEYDLGNARSEFANLKRKLPVPKDYDPITDEGNYARAHLSTVLLERYFSKDVEGYCPFSTVFRDIPVCIKK